MTRKNSFAFIILILLLFGCDSNSNKTFEKTKLYVKFDHTPGLTTKSPVTNKGLLIGKVSGLKIHNDSVLVEINLDSGQNIPRASKFIFYSVDMLGTKGIRVETSKQNTFFTSGETITGTVTKSVSLADQLKDISKEDIKKIRKNISLLLNLSEKELDSIVHQLLKNKKGKINIDSVHSIFRKKEITE